ncbi:hypothetical protein KIN20_021865 [Parelaphostrongylus tenuis]|uniref:Uncharacterized protein n=1 Tax=Parelaphostrongylus tenuis TaxID=148309 RepID=A0AAD5MPU7_PARTN|nr:hypothetical protein KIN20_021865 [Parelaphostrongylus tenuis]
MRLNKNGIQQALKPMLQKNFTKEGRNTWNILRKDMRENLRLSLKALFVKFHQKTMQQSGKLWQK